MTDNICHYCEENQTEYFCPRCDLPTCEDCFEPLTQFNAGFELSCLGCENRRQTEAADEYEQNLKYEEEKKHQKKHKNDQARKRYWKPENVAKRKAKKIKQKEAKRQQEIKSLMELAKIFFDWQK